MSQTSGYTRIANATLQNAKLSFEARGALTYLLSKPTGWKVQPADLQREGNCGRDRVYRILKELKDAGYLTRPRYRQADGTFKWGDYELAKTPHPAQPDTDQPYTENTDMDTPYSEATQPYTENTEVEPYTPLPYTEKPDTENTEILKTKESYKQKNKDHRASRDSSDHTRLMALYAEALPDNRIPNGAQEGKAAKAILAAGYTPEQAMQVYQYLKRRDFYADQHLSLATVNKQMGAVLDAIKRGVPSGRRNGHQPSAAFEKATISFSDLDKGF